MCVECCPCDLFMEGSNTRHLHHHIEWYINRSTEKQNIKMDICSYFRSASKSSVVSRNLRLMYSPILLRSIAQVLLLNHLPSQDLESGDTTKSGKKLFPG